LINNANTLKHIVGVVNIISSGNTKNINQINQTINNTVTRFHADNYLAGGGCERVVADEGGVTGDVVGGGGGGGKGETRGSEGGEGHQGSRWREPFAGLEEEVRPVDGLERER